MKDLILFDSRCEADRAPFGAVEAGTVLSLRLRASRRLALRGVTMVVIRDDDNSRREYPMTWEDMSEGYDVYTLHAAFPDTGLYWYLFRAEGFDGQRWIGRKGRRAQLSDDPASWQLTVYDPAFATPEWIRGGAYYHIFVDRFHSAGGHEAAPGTIRRKWGETPEYRPDEKGIIRNNDFFGGDLEGVTEKLDYLKDLGVTCIYLSPIFRAASNHKYDTGDYMSIDPAFGDDESFSTLCAKAKERGIRVICDGVFNHTGDDSVYFNRYGNYDSLGAYQSKESPYYSWFDFTQWPEKYGSWWGVDTLPQVREEDPGYREFICGDDGVVRKWLRLGASGWRLDVADELPEDFLQCIRTAARTEKSDALVLGEVWEDASNKIAYGFRRHYFHGAELDTVMNYPFKNAILNFLQGGDGAALAETVETICENYPAPALHCLMNSLSTHDTPRALTVLGGKHYATRDERAAAVLTPEEKDAAREKMRLAAVLQCTLPGVPCVFYGDEAGMEGYEDPFCRGCFPWGNEDAELTAHYRSLLRLRGRHKVFREGSFRVLCAEAGRIVYERCGGGKCIRVSVDRNSMEFRIESVNGDKLHALYTGGSKRKKGESRHV